MIPRKLIINHKAKCQKCGEWTRVHGIYRYHDVYICKVCCPNKMPLTYKKEMLCKKVVTQEPKGI